jgi:hypothetical protein
MPLITAALMGDLDGTEAASIWLYLTVGLVVMTWLGLSTHGGKRRKREKRLKLEMETLRAEMATAGHLARVRVNAFYAAETDAEKVNLIERILLWTDPNPAPGPQALCPPPLPPVDLLLVRYSDGH